MKIKTNLLVVSALAVSILLTSLTLPSLTQAQTPDCNILVFSKTEGYRHPSISDGISAITDLAPDVGLTVDFTEDANQFTTTNLTNYAAVVFLSTTGNILNTSQEAAFESFIQAGNGFVGVHAATDTEYGWTWYNQLIGTHFANHPNQQNATLNIIDNTHPSTSHLSMDWVRFDEWYNFQNQPVGVTTLITIDETTYNGGTMGDPHPISWYKEFDGGRSWYTAMGHTRSTYDEPDFRQHLINGIVWSADAENCATPTQINLFSQSTDIPPFATILITITLFISLVTTALFLRRASQR